MKTKLLTGSRSGIAKGLHKNAEALPSVALVVVATLVVLKELMRAFLTPVLEGSLASYFGCDYIRGAMKQSFYLR